MNLCEKGLYKWWLRIVIDMNWAFTAYSVTHYWKTVGSASIGLHGKLTYEQSYFMWLLSLATENLLPEPCRLQLWPYHSTTVGQTGNPCVGLCSPFVNETGAVLFICLVNWRPLISLSYYDSTLGLDHNSC